MPESSPGNQQCKILGSISKDEGYRQLAGIHWTEEKEKPKSVHFSQHLMRITSSLLESDETNKITHWFLSQTARQNKWGKMYLHPKVRQLTAEEITQAETHSLKSINKALPERPILAQSGSPTYYIRKLIDIFLLPIVKKEKKERKTER